MSEKCFYVKFKCRNCGNKFKEEFEKGDEIDNGFFAYKLNSHKCSGKVTCSHCRTIECPVCESEKLGEIERNPICEEDNGEDEVLFNIGDDKIPREIVFDAVDKYIEKIMREQEFACGHKREGLRGFKQYFKKYLDKKV